MKILIAAPTSEAKDYCFDEYAANVKKIRKAAKKQGIETEFLLIDNTPGITDYCKKIEDRNIECVLYPRLIKNEPLSHVLFGCWKGIRTYFVDKNFDYWFMLETDQFPPADVLPLLLSFEKDVISLPYYTGYGSQSSPLMYGIEKNDKEKTIAFKELSPKEKINTITGGLTAEIHNNGTGCMLVKRFVIEKIPFRYDHDVYPDTLFHVDLLKNGIKNWLYTGAVSVHKSGNWDVIKDIELLTEISK